MRIVAGQRAVAMVRKLANRRAQADPEIEATVRRIVADVRKNGEPALRRHARKFDGLGASEPLRISAAELERAWRECSSGFRNALKTAAKNIRRFAQKQRPREWRYEIAPGVCAGQLVRPLSAVGCYVPGGRYPLPSSLLMTVIPAQIAGVERIVVTSPRPVRETLAAAALLGVREFYRVGGAQAIAALAYGAGEIARVAKIVGPGNAYVTAAKKAVAFDCAIDFLAGPTEVAIVAEQGDARFIAADLVAQAEHDADAVAIFITTSRALASQVADEVAQQSRVNVTARESLHRNGAILLAASGEQAMDWANQIAPEHLTVPSELVPAVRNAGSVFVGEYSPQAAGDYASGPNHVLPTGGSAAFRGGLSPLDFVKLITVQELSRAGLARLGETITRLAEGEGLAAHAASVRIRLEAARRAHA